MKLPLCSLRVMMAGQGEPLIMVPATLSELENWQDLTQFMGQWFRAHFFELPGHGGSTPLPREFSSDLVAEAVNQLVDHLGARRFSLMGFSFGGILAMKIFSRLRARIDRVILLAPCITARAMRLSPVQRLVAVRLNGLLKDAGARQFLHQAMRGQVGSELLSRVVNLIGKVENRPYLAWKLRQLRPAVMEIVSHELDEILNIEFPRPLTRYSTPCYVAMSIHDPLLSYDITLEAVRAQFERVQVATLQYPFHQPAKPFTLQELNAAHSATVNEFLNGHLA